jgi:hypothetical protein
VKKGVLERERALIWRVFLGDRRAPAHISPALGTGKEEGGLGRARAEERQCCVCVERFVLYA